MPPKRCCCGFLPLDCHLLTDDFERADSSDLGSDWTVESGSPAISSGRLTMTAGDAVATVAASLPSRRGVGQIVLASTGASVTLSVGTASVTLSFGSTSATAVTGAQTRTITDTNVGQPDSLLWRLSGDDSYLFGICVTNNLLVGSIQGLDDGAILTCWDHEFTLPTSGDGKLHILVNSGAIAIETLTFARHWHDSEQWPTRFSDTVGCYECACECTSTLVPPEDSYYVPWKLRIDFYSDDGSGAGCDAFNGGFLEFESVPDSYVPDVGTYWVCSDGEVVGTQYGYGSGNPMGDLYICTGLGEHPKFEINWSPPSCTMLDGLHPNLGTLTCNPISLTYGPFCTTDGTEHCDPCVTHPGCWYGILTDATP